MAGPLDKHLNPSTRLPGHPTHQHHPDYRCRYRYRYRHEHTDRKLPDWHYDILLAARINRSATDVIHLNFVAIWI